MARRTVAVTFVVAFIGATILGASTPAQAFTEGPSNNFFGDNAGANTNTGVANSFFGASAGNANTGGGGNSAFGVEAGRANVSSHNNSAFGFQAGEENTASENAFFGANAGRVSTSGFSNAFFGASSGFFNTTGSSNSFFGHFAGRSNTTASQNSFFGANAGFANTGIDNSFFGFKAGFNNGIACCNSFFGASAGIANTDGFFNSFFGDIAGRDNTTGDFNSFFGREAGRANTTASNNSIFGAQAGFNNTTGTDNSFFGLQAGFSNTTAPNNSIFGARAGFANTTGADNAFFGVNAGFNNTDGVANSAFGTSAGISNTAGRLNTFFGHSAGLSNTVEDGNTFIGTISNGIAGITNATAVGQSAQVSQSNSLVLGSIDGENGATSNVRVGIGTPTPAEPLHVRRTDGTAKALVEEASGTTLGRELFQLTNNGAARFRVRNTANNTTWDFQTSGGGGSFVIDRVGGPVSLDFEIQADGDAVHLGTVTAAGFITSSDRTKKTDITPANARKLMAMLRELDISTWRFKSQPKGTVNLGPMAQDFHRLFGMGTSRTIDVRDLAALALVAAQVLDASHGDLRDDVNSLELENTDLRKRVERLEALVSR